MSLFPWFVVTLLIAMNALYVAAEFSAVAVQRSAVTRLAREGSARAASLLRVLEDGHALDRYIAACQIGITLSSLIVGAYGQATIGVDLAALLERGLGLTASAAASSAALTVLVVLTALQVVLGELVPKSLALQFPTESALLTYPPTQLSVRLYRPFIWFLNGSAIVLLKPFGVSPGGHQHVHSPEEIEILFAESRRAGRLAPDEHRRLQRGLHLSERTARQLMVPRADVVAIEVSTPIEELVQILRASAHSRLPVYRASLDEILGTVDLKHVVGRYADEGALPPLEELVRKIPFVPETLTADRLVRFLREHHASKAIVVDEFGVLQGIVSIEDVLAELFADRSELEQEGLAKRLPDGGSRLPGSMPLVDAERWLGVPLPTSAATLAGYVIESLGHLPEAGESLTAGGLDLVVVEVEPPAVRWIEVRPRADEKERR